MMTNATIPYDTYSPKRGALSIECAWVGLSPLAPPTSPSVRVSVGADVGEAAWEGRGAL